MTFLQLVLKEKLVIDSKFKITDCPLWFRDMVSQIIA